MKGMSHEGNIIIILNCIVFYLIIAPNHITYLQLIEKLLEFHIFANTDFDSQLALGELILCSVYISVNKNGRKWPNACAQSLSHHTPKDLRL